MTKFQEDYETGDIGVAIFIGYFGISQVFKDVPIAQKEDYDILMNGSTFELKTNYHDNGNIFFEEWTNREKGLKGWIATSKADYIVFISKDTKLMLMYDLNALRAWYKTNYQFIKGLCPLRKNKPTTGLYGDIWCSEYRVLTLDQIGMRPIVLQG